ncbi:uncharacterized protein LOC142550817 [Primulina tabacum]|uniref:uncharacterized protein LOC142550817 n=1 Tax=Primulina tabacum TaxID=48773 RepID=UPI003F5ADD8D
MDSIDIDAIIKIQRHLREHIEMLQTEFNKLAVNAEVAGRLQQADKRIVYQHNWEKLKTRICINPTTNRVDVSGKYPRDYQNGSRKMFMKLGRIMIICPEEMFWSNTFLVQHQNQQEKVQSHGRGPVGSHPHNIYANGNHHGCLHESAWFECWLHPARYRTQPCKDGTRCRRRVCFFAHTPEQLRILPHATSPDTSPSVLRGVSFVALGLFGSSPKSSSYSPSVSPKTLSPWFAGMAVPELERSPPLARGELMNINSVDQLAEAMRRRLQINNMKMGMGLGMSPPSRGAEFGLPRSQKMIRTMFTSLPSTPIRTRALKHARLGPCDIWETSCQEDSLMEYPEFRVGLVDFANTDPDVGSKLVNSYLISLIVRAD